MALDLIGGGAFAVLYDRVSRAVDKNVAFKQRLRDMKRTLESLKAQAGVIQEIGVFNVEMSLRNEDVDDLQTQIIEGTKVVCGLCGVGVLSLCCNDGCGEQLDELNRNLERLLGNLRLQQARDIKEILKYARKSDDDVEELKRMVKELLTKKEEETGEKNLATEKKEIEGNGKKQVTSSPSSSSLGGRLGAAMLALYGAVLEVKDRNVMYRPLLGSIKSTLDCLKPLIEDMERGNAVLNRPVKELEYFRMHMEEGVDLVRKCARNGFLAKYKTKKYANRLMELDACLQQELNLLSVQVASHVRETTAAIRTMQEMIKRIQESGVVKDQIEVNGPREVTDSAFVDEESEGLVLSDKMEEIEIGVDGSGGMRKMIKWNQDGAAMKVQAEMNGPCEVAESSSCDHEKIGLVLLNQMEEAEIGFDGSEVNGPGEVAEFSSCDEKKSGLVEPSYPDEEIEVLVLLNEMEAAYIGIDGSVGVQDDGEVSSRFVVPESPLFTVGLDVAMTEVKKMLLDEDGFNKICVSGVGGIGKTTLAKMLCHDQDVKDKFQDIFFTTASKWPNLNLIMEELCRVIYSQVPTFRNEEGRHCLIVLDDVSAGSESILHEFDGLEILNSKILITSRYAFSGLDSQYHLKPLNYEDSVSLFQLSVSLGERSSIPQDLLRKIVEFCKGLPLAISVIGRSLCGQPIEIWQERIVEYGRCPSNFYSETEMVVCLQTSWDALNREENIIQKCFQDLASFPEDQIIPAAALIDVWTELYGVEDESQSIANLHWLADCGLASLVSREETEVAADSYNDLYVTLHPMLRGLAIHKASEDTIEERKRLFLNIPGENLPSWWTAQRSQPKNARLLSISTDLAVSRNWHPMLLPNCEVMVLNFWTEKYELPDFLDKADKLKVLIATNYRSLPAELSNFQLLSSLRNLKRIRLEGVSIASMIKNHIHLPSLKKVAFSKCDVGQAFSGSSLQFSVAFPNLDEINVLHCDDLVELPADLGNLSQLETLYISNCHKLSTLPVGIGDLSKLKRLRVRCCTNLEKIPGSIGKLKRLELLDIAGCINIVGLPEDIGEMSGLRKLNVSGCSSLKELPLSFSRLEKLHDMLLNKETEKLWKPFLPKSVHTRDMRRLRTPNVGGCSRFVEQPLSVSSHGKEAIQDEEMNYPFKFLLKMLLKDSHTGVASLTQVISTVALKGLNRSVIRDDLSKHVECGITGTLQHETLCHVHEPCSHTVGFDLLDVSEAMKMEETLNSEVRPNQIVGSGRVAKTLNIKGALSEIHDRNIIVCRGSSSTDESQWWKAEETDVSQTAENPRMSKVILRLKVATRNFRPAGVIGPGASGNMFKGNFLGRTTLAPSKVGSSMPVAITKLNPRSALDFEEWQRLDGSIVSDYNLVPYASLEGNYLFERLGKPLSWNIRMKIASGVAQALIYLHSCSVERVVHCDLKASNILLDGNFNEKLSDFGLERHRRTGELPHQSACPIGTPSYMSPEYLTTDHFNQKSDVYSFGVILLQLLTGKRTNDSIATRKRQNLVEWAKPLLVNQRLLETIMDVRMKGQYSSAEAFEVAQLTRKCLATDPERPSMKQVVEELERIQALDERIRQSKPLALGVFASSNVVDDSCDDQRTRKS